MNNPKSNTERASPMEEMIDTVRESTAESIESAAESVRAAGNQGAQAISGLANDAGEKLDSTADYVRNLATGDMFGEFRQNVCRHPVASVTLAAAIGLLAGVTCRRSRPAC